MDKLLQDEFGLNKKVRTRIILCVTAFLILTIFICIGLYFSTKKVITKQVTNNVTNISELNESSVSRAIINRRMLLQMISQRLAKRNINDISVILRELEDFRRAYDFNSMGVLDEKDVFYLTNGVVKQGSDFIFLDDVKSDGFNITESLKPLDNGKYMVNMFSYPIYYEDGTRYTLFATYYSKHLTERMNITSLKGAGYTFLLNSEGRVVIFSQDYDDEQYNSLMKYVDNHSESIPYKTGDKYFRYNGEDYYAHVEKLEINDWYLMTCARKADVFADVNIIIRNGSIAIGIVWLLIILSIVLISLNIYRSNKERRHFAFYDALLNVGNGNAMTVVFSKLSEKALKNMYLAVFDIDKFKEFNYIYGEENGDRLLKYIADVFKEEFPDTYLFRYYSDNFVFWGQSKNKQEFEARMNKLLQRFGNDTENGIIQPFDISVGVRKIGEGESLRRIISDALIAKGTIKGNHIKHHAFYNDAIRLQRINYMEMESDFLRALREKEFRVYYQPKYDIRTGDIIGAEALARWVKADDTIISPAAFIPCFENSRQIVLLDEYILKEVCRQMKEMQSEGIDVKPVSVNMSRIHLRHPDILPKISAIIKDYEIDPRKLSFEITESVLLEQGIPVKDILSHLHELGCRVDMDDYGVGASNFDALVSNDFDTLKLDKSFVDRIGDERAEDLIRSTSHLARKWGMQVLAEGVEEKKQADRLVELGCAYAQGFYFSRPVPEADYKALLKGSSSSAGGSSEISTKDICFSEEICNVLDGNPLPAYIIDPENFIVMYCNKAMRKYIADPIGGVCYQKIRKREKPCEQCSAMRLYCENDDSPKEIRSPWGGWLLVQTAPLYWKGKTFIQVTGVDITKQKDMEQEMQRRTRRR